MYIKYGEGLVKHSNPSCEFLTEWGRCQQPKYKNDFCSYHFNAQNVEGFIHDRFYHKKIVLALTRPSHDILTNVEVDALFRGRTRNDGRRTDLYTVL
mgnify:CR=1 FL=1